MSYRAANFNTPVSGTFLHLLRTRVPNRFALYVDVERYHLDPRVRRLKTEITVIGDKAWWQARDARDY